MVPGREYQRREAKRKAGEWNRNESRIVTQRRELLMSNLFVISLLLVRAKARIGLS
jgi:hypothetical protein